MHGVNTDITQDTIALCGAGTAALAQPRRGHRFTTDALLLADFCRIKPHDRVLEPGAGTGGVSILLAKKFPGTTYVADEIEPFAYALLCRNIADNGLHDTIEPVSGDLAALRRSFPSSSFDVIVANPPYRKDGTGRRSPVAARQTARHDHAAPLPAWLDLQVFLKNRGRYILIFPVDRFAELIDCLRKRGLEPKRLRFVHPFPDRPALLLLLEAVKSAGIGLEILPPLVLHAPDGGYSDEVRRIYCLDR